MIVVVVGEVRDIHPLTSIPPASTNAIASLRSIADFVQVSVEPLLPRMNPTEHSKALSNVSTVKRSTASLSRAIVLAQLTAIRIALVDPALTHCATELVIESQLLIIELIAATCSSHVSPP